MITSCAISSSAATKLHAEEFFTCAILDSIEVSIPACHAGDPGSIPGRGDQFFYIILRKF